LIDIDRSNLLSGLIGVLLGLMYSEYNRWRNKPKLEIEFQKIDDEKKYVHERSIPKKFQKEKEIIHKKPQQDIVLVNQRENTNVKLDNSVKQ